jgi:hypothetical protein
MFPAAPRRQRFGRAPGPFFEGARKAGIASVKLNALLVIAKGFGSAYFRRSAPRRQSAGRERGRVLTRGPAPLRREQLEDVWNFYYILSEIVEGWYEIQMHWLMI